MYIVCPKCNRNYDTHGYPPGYMFACHCSQVLQTPLAYQQGQKVTGSQPFLPLVSTSQMNLPQLRPISNLNLPLVSTSQMNLPSVQNPAGMQSPLVDSHEETGLLMQDYGERTISTHSEFSMRDLGDDEDYSTSKREGFSGIGIKNSSEYWEQAALDGQISDEELYAKKNSPHAVWSVLLSFLVLLGPLVLLLATVGFFKIKKHSELLKGKGFAIVGLFLGLIQTSLLGALIFLLVAPESFPTELQAQRNQFFSWFRKESKREKRTEESDVLSKAIAIRELQKQEGFSPNAQEMFLSLVGEKRETLVVWKDDAQKKIFSSLFYYTSQKYWQWVKKDVQPFFEVGVFSKGAPLLSTEIAQKLIHAFWQKRKGFGDSKVVNMWIEHGKKHIAHAHWILEKNEGTQKRRWSMESAFLYSQEGNWHLVRYARKEATPKILVPQKAKAELSKKELETMFSSYFLGPKDAPSPFLRVVFWKQNQARNQALACLEPAFIEGLKNKTTNTTPKTNHNCFRFVRGQDEKWLLFQVSSLAFPKGKLISFLSKKFDEKKAIESLQLEEEVVVSLAETTLFPSQGVLLYLQTESLRKSKKTRLLQWFQDEEGKWILFEQKEKANHSIVFLENDGISVKLTSKIARLLIREFWKENAALYAGARVVELLTVSDPENSIEYEAYWSNQKTSQLELKRTLFSQSIEGKWFLKQYEVFPTFQTQFFEVGPPLLTRELAKKILLKRLERDSFGDLFVFQKSPETAIVGWQQEGKSQHSQFHYSEGKWYLTSTNLFLSPKLILPSAY